ncbi:MAG: AAA family ATPase [Pseudolabrys sp.]|nr:AAA family ATPase [Pseudolabrys sp.]
MSIERSTRAGSARVIVVANEKGGSGKSTVAMHLAVGLMKSGLRVATVDLDARQRSLTAYIENRRIWAGHIGRDLGFPTHVCLESRTDALAGAQPADGDALIDTVRTLGQDHDFIILDTPGHDGELMRRAHAVADTVVTPLNDSFVDFDVLGAIDPVTFGITGIRHYARIVDEARRERRLRDGVAFDWIVTRNRLSAVGSRNKRLMGECLRLLAEKLDFRCVDGLGERVIFREFYPRGLTALDDLDEATLGTRPTMSHVTARLEIEGLLNAVRLGAVVASEDLERRSRDAA